MVNHYAEIKRLVIVLPEWTEEESLHVYGDQRRYEQVIINLLSNSIKFSNDDSKIELTLKMLERELVNDKNILLGRLNEQEKVALLESQNSQSKMYCIKFQIKIQDFGDGMPAEKLLTLFKDFSKLEDSDGKNTEGRGLGLSIVKQIVELMDGSIHVNSEKGCGS